VTWTDLILALIAALMLALERACYVAVWREPTRFRVAVVDWVGPAVEPVGALANLFVVFKFLQATVFLGWCLYFGGGRLLPADAPLAVLAAGTGLIVAGQVLNAAVFVRLGLTGVFYGNRFGHAIHWRYGFPFSWLRHPQYVGTVATIWGVFLALRFPNPDWIVLPLLETAYYVAGAFLEDDATPPASARDVAGADPLADASPRQRP
jgi:methylene-fatty-acyl-phospholipid synthase